MAGWKFGQSELRGYGPSRSGFVIDNNIEHWTSANLGWSFPCAEDLGLIRSCLGEPSSRIIDVGAGRGLWTRVLRKCFGVEKVVGLDPCPKDATIIESTFERWCEDSNGLRESDVILASWLPCEHQSGEDLGARILECIKTNQSFVYIGSGSHGPTGTEEFYDHLPREFEEHGTEPLPRFCPDVYPRDFARVFRRKM